MNRKISFCILVSNSFKSLKKTLRKNLDDNFLHHNIIEFIILSFEENDSLEKWLHEGFKKELATGYLKLIKRKKHANWHPAYAKNQFKKTINSEIYVSLNCYSFIDKQTTTNIINTFENKKYNCVLHLAYQNINNKHSHGIAISKRNFLKISYDSYFLPKQWHELDLIITAITKIEDIHYLPPAHPTHDQCSVFFARFLAENNIDTDFPPPICSESNSLTSELKKHNVKLEHFNYFNAYSSFFKNTKECHLRNSYVARLRYTQNLMLKNIKKQELLSLFLQSHNKSEPCINDTSIILASCIKNETNLKNWIAHYKKLGVTHFFLIDDNSYEPIIEKICEHKESVWVWKPLAGKFRYSKKFWIELLLQNYAINNWVITVDSDEYIDLPQKTENRKHTLTSLTNRANELEINYFFGLLIDMIPGPQHLNSLLENKHLSQDCFDYYFYTNEQPDIEYKENDTVLWSYGDTPEIGFKIDVRYWLNKSFDSLRKIPIFKMTESTELNQGFHKLIIDGEELSSDNLKRKDLIIIKHYKLFNSQLDAEDSILRPLSAYYHTTQINLKKLRLNLNNLLIKASSSENSYPYKNIGKHFNSKL